MSQVWPYIAIVFLIILSAYFSGSEITFNAANKLRLKKASETDKISKVAYEITENFNTALSAILIGNNLVNVAASTISTVITINILASMHVGQSDGLGATIATVIMTIIILIFGEILPKIVAKQNADKYIRYIAYPTKILTIILYPIVFIVTMIIKGLSKIWGKDKFENEPTVTEDELSTMIETVEEEGGIDEEKSDLLQSTLDFSDTTVGEILTPRKDMTAIDIDDDFPTILKTVNASHFSRIPVYRDNIDNIVGILYLNHFYRAYVGNKEVDIKQILMKPFFIHKSMKLQVALNQMRERKQHLAIVIDEFGGTLGIVTMEDILEEIVGDIWDESDEIVKEYNETAPGVYDVSFDMNIDDFFELVDIDGDDVDTEYTTVGGWAIEMLDSDPAVGKSFTFQNITVTVTEMDALRVLKLHVVVTPNPDDDDDDNID